MIGFHADISNDVNRIFLTRLINSNIKLKATKSRSQYGYSFIVAYDGDLPHIREIRNVMIKIYDETNVPIV